MVKRVPPRWKRGPRPEHGYRKDGHLSTSCHVRLLECEVAVAVLEQDSIVKLQDTSG